jgi:hypothetical protein
MLNKSGQCQDFTHNRKLPSVTLICQHDQQLDLDLQVHVIRLSKHSEHNFIRLSRLLLAYHNNILLVNRNRTAYIELQAARAYNLVTSMRSSTCQVWWLPTQLMAPPISIIHLEILFQGVSSVHYDDEDKSISQLVVPNHCYSCSLITRVHLLRPNDNKLRFKIRSRQNFKKISSIWFQQQVGNISGFIYCNLCELNTISPVCLCYSIFQLFTLYILIIHVLHTFSFLY